ncbi:hypothetical protein ACSTCY_22975, partial [Klebsiella pneumoniae]|uniref:hypothetical protein n=1 Tax=Klebsiella pneumoniae TaxID=573 RepID=UPI003F60F2C7
LGPNLGWGFGLTVIGLGFVCFGSARNPHNTKCYRRGGGGYAALYRAKELGRSRIVSFGRLKTS